MSAGMIGSYIYTSTNYGQTWKASTSTKQYWVGLAMSSSGQNQVAVVGPNTYSTGKLFIMMTSIEYLNNCFML